MNSTARLSAGSQAADAHAYSSASGHEPGRGLMTASRWWIAGGIGFIAIIAFGTAAAILTARGSAVSLKQRELQNMAFVLAAGANDDFEAIERVQTDLIERLEVNLASPEE